MLISLLNKYIPEMLISLLNKYIPEMLPISFYLI